MSTDSNEAALNYDALGRDQLIGELRWRDKILADARRERRGLVAQMQRCDELLNEAGVQDEHHGKERPLTLDERLECLIDKIDEMQSELDDQGNAYISAVGGRKAFREAYRKARGDLRHCRDEFGKIAALRDAEDANEPFDDALDIADAAIAFLDQPRGLSAADEPCSEGVTPNPPEVS